MRVPSQKVSGRGRKGQPAVTHSVEVFIPGNFEGDKHAEALRRAKFKLAKATTFTVKHLRDW
jgi:hypothetical protein